MTSEPIWWCRVDNRQASSYGFTDVMYPCEYQGGRRPNHKECGPRFFVDSAPDDVLIEVLVERGVLVREWGVAYGDGRGQWAPWRLVGSWNPAEQVENKEPVQ